MRLSCIARGVSSPEQHGTPVKEPVASEGGPHRLNEALCKGTLADSVRAQNDDEKTGGL